jgi:hypothetical protein
MVDDVCFEDLHSNFVGVFLCIALDLHVKCENCGESGKDFCLS